MRASVKASWWSTLVHYVPLFVLGFVAASAVRTLGDWRLLATGSVCGLTASQWKGAIDAIGNSLAPTLLGTAMAAVGLSTDLRALHGVGVRPFAVGGLAFVTMGVAAAALLNVRHRYDATTAATEDHGQDGSRKGRR